MGNFKPSEYSIKNAILESARYNGGIFVGDNYITKDHGDYIEVNIEVNNHKGHDSINLYFYNDGRLKSAVPHPTNTVFTKRLDF